MACFRIRCGQYGLVQVMVVDKPHMVQAGMRMKEGNGVN